ncbi:Mediator of RNA polymerase II transcription subunit 12 [Folsomia candida]|uniref:Mediator of RNA polymerase II transcription subunit 12 n=1 Tax=Folsomia candida TaxID=158441 RepID=A0A226DDW2_FOLCA|nr:Mediator of RNA polymerase II transcription subunit 12 [Folsomia candida]
MGLRPSPFMISCVVSIIAIVLVSLMTAFVGVLFEDNSPFLAFIVIFAAIFIVFFSVFLVFGIVLLRGSTEEKRWMLQGVVDRSHHHRCRPVLLQRFLVFAFDLKPSYGHFCSVLLSLYFYFVVFCFIREIKVNPGGGGGMLWGVQSTYSYQPAYSVASAQVAYQPAQSYYQPAYPNYNYSQGNVNYQQQKFQQPQQQLEQPQDNQPEPNQ